MSTNAHPHRPGLPTKSTAFVHFALDVVELLQQSRQFGLDKNGFLNAFFHGTPPTTEADQEAWWNEFKRAKDYSNECFKKGMAPWAWIRARPGATKGQYFYMIVGQREGDRVKIEGDAANLDLLDAFTDRRWRTQTQSRQRVRASRGLALIDSGVASGDQRLIDKGQSLLNEFITLSPGLAAMNFDTGIVMDDLERLANSTDPRIRLLNHQIRNALNSARNFERDLAPLVDTVLALADIYQKGSMKALP